MDVCYRLCKYTENCFNTGWSNAALPISFRSLLTWVQNCGLKYSHLSVTRTAAAGDIAQVQITPTFHKSLSHLCLHRSCYSLSQVIDLMLSICQQIKPLLVSFFCLPPPPPLSTLMAFKCAFGNKVMFCTRGNQLKTYFMVKSLVCKTSMWKYPNECFKFWRQGISCRRNLGADMK